MSHIVTIRTKLHDPTALAAACTRLGLQTPVQGTAQLFSGEVSGLVVKLPGWEYPVVVDTLSGNVRYDDFGGRWGERRHLDHLLQMYAVEAAKLEARKQGFSVSEQTLDNGSIKLQIVEHAS
jgi:hypothetical protein